MGLLGLGYTHSDLGGFAGGETFDKEMYIRWLQYGVFQPVYRPHAQEHIPPEPVFHDRETRRIVRDYIELRYRLLPYHYTLAYENSTTGMPLMRPVFFEDETNPDLIDVRDTYLWGDAFLVRPVTDPGVDSVSVDLPAGTWFNFWDDTRVDGGQAVDTAVTLETIPVYVRAGSFVPMVPLVQTTRDYSSENLQLHYYADASVKTASGMMFDDDGADGRSLELGQFETLRFDARQDDGLELTLEQSGRYDGMPASRRVELIVHNWIGEPAGVRIADRDVEVKRRPPRKGDSVGYNADDRLLTIRFDWDHAPIRITVR